MEDEINQGRKRNRQSSQIETQLKRTVFAQLKLHQLRIFLEVARQGGISRAARSLHVAQPAVTKTLREFEQLFGTPLFERQARGVALNDIGELVLPHVRAVFADLNRMAEDLHSYRVGTSGSVAVGVTMSVLPYLMPQCLAGPEIQSAKGSIRVVEGTIDQLTQSLEAGELDLVFGRVLTGRGRMLFVQEILFEEPFVPVVGSDHPLSGKIPATLRRLSAYPWIMPPAGSSAAEPLDHYMARNDIRPVRRIIETISYQTIVRLLENTDSVAILPRLLARAGARKGQLFIVGPALEDGRLAIGITRRNDRALSPLASRLMEAFRAEARDYVTAE